MNFIVYILSNERKNKFYIGFMSTLEERLIRHNQISKGFSGNINDLKVVYVESNKTSVFQLKTFTST